VRKADLDREVAVAVGDDLGNVSMTTSAFLQQLMEALARGDEVLLQGFGKFRLARQGGAPPPHKRFGGGHNDPEGQNERFRVHFSKSMTFARAVKEAQKENAHGKARR
jgi:hypothetical protein